MKSQLRKWLSEAEFQQIIVNASEHGRTVSTLIALTYDTDPLIQWRALDAVGRCAEKLCTTRAEALKNLLRRLFWQMSDEAGSMAWHAPEAIGEIIRADPRAFADFIPLTVSLLYLEPEDLPRFLPGTLYALGRIGGKQPVSVRGGLLRMLEALTADDVQARAMAVWCLGQIGKIADLMQHPELAKDQGEAIVYRGEQVVTSTVAGLYAEALKPVQSNTPIS